MGDMDYSKAFARLDVDHKFLCERKVDCNRWNCKGCDYYYEHSEYHASRCLKKDLRDWTLYQIDNSEK